MAAERPAATVSDSLLDEKVLVEVPQRLKKTKRSLRMLQKVGLQLFGLTLATVLLGGDAVAQNKCAGGKIKAAGKKAKCLLDLEAKAAATGIAADPTKVQKCKSKLTSTFTKHEGKGGCATSGDAQTIEDKVDTFVADVAAQLTQACPAAGISFAGNCWYFGTGNSPESCDDVCAAKGLTCNETATRDTAGSGGTLANCVAIVDLLHPAGAPHGQADNDNTTCGSPDLGIGCSEFHGGELDGVVRTTAPLTTCAADGAGGSCVSGRQRVCACQ